MLARKVTIYTSEDAVYHHQRLHDAVLTFLMKKGVAGATVSRALAGFGHAHKLRTAAVEALAEHLPIRIEFVDTPEKIDPLLPVLREMAGGGLIDVQDTVVVEPAGAPAAEAPHAARRQSAQLLRVFLGEADRWGDEPLYEAIVKRLRTLGIAGATVYRGILGYGAKGHQHKRSFFHPMRDLPVVVSVVDSPAQIDRAAAAVEEMLTDGLLVVSDVEMVRLERGHAAG